VNAEFNVWLLIVGLVVGAGLVWLVIMDTRRREVEIDSRPSDAIALAVRCDAQIFADDDVVEESGIEFQADDDEQPRLVTASNLADLDPAEFRQFLETVTPEEFATSLTEQFEDAEELEEVDEPEADDEDEL